MTKNWSAVATVFRAQHAMVSSRQPSGLDSLQRRMDCFGPRREPARTGQPTAPPQLLDAALIACGDALEAAWQVELRAMIAARRGGDAERGAAQAARAASEAIVRRIEAARALTLDGLKVKSRAEFLAA